LAGPAVVTEYREKAVAGKPDNTAALANLALALSMAGRSGEVIPHEEAAIKLSGGGDPTMLGFLGSLYATAGRLPEAVAVTRQALELATRMNDRGLAAELQSDLAGYQSRR
jgi:Flp pilus assembly protein TadD